MNVKKSVGVIMGGPSCERDISLKSGKAVLSSLTKQGISVLGIELARDGKERDYSDYVKNELKKSGIEAAFIALHGKFGEDGKIQSILDEMHIPYTGSKADASRRSMDKVESKAVFESNGIPTPRHKIIRINELDKRLDGQVYFKELGIPLVIKPSSEGSSIGMSIIDSPEAFPDALREAAGYGGEVIIEEHVKGREITVGIVGEDALPIVEIVPGKMFFDFEAKYKKGLTYYKVPAEIDKRLYKESQEIALKAHKALGAESFSRVDMIIGNNGQPVVLEINTIPGFTETSLLPKAALAAGVKFEQLVLKIMESALW